MRSVWSASVLEPAACIWKLLTIKTECCYPIFVFCWCAFVETNDEDFRFDVHVARRASTRPIR